MAVITIGSPAIDRPGNIDAHTNTIVDNNGPATGTGKITEVGIYVHTTATFVNLTIGIFYVVSGNNLSTRDSVALGEAAPGLRTFAVDLSVEAGDYIGIVDAGPSGVGHLEHVAPGWGARWSRAGVQIPCTNVAFLLFPDTLFSLYGTGKTPPAVTSLTPDSGPVDEEVIIDGTDFEDTQGTGGVTVDGIPADIVSWTDTEIIITIPAGVACGDVNVIVTTAHGQISNAFTLNVECPSRRSVLQLPPIGWPIGGGLGRPPIMG